jgi:hypothetical protein
MPKEQRVIIFAATFPLLLLVYLAFRTPIDTLGDKGIVILSCLIMLSFTTLLVEHFFTRPTDVIASSVSILLLIAPLHGSLNETGHWYWLFFSYNILILFISLLSLALFDGKKSETASLNKVSAKAKTIAVRFGNGKFLWSWLLALCLFFYVDSQSPLFIALFAYAGILLLIDPKKAIMTIASLSKKSDSEVARLFGVQSGNAFLARVFPNAKPASRLDVVGFISSIGGSKNWTTGLVIDTYELNEQRWMKILTDDSLVEITHKVHVPDRATDGSVHLLRVNEELEIVKRLVGIVCEGSVIDKLRFEYIFNGVIQEGDLLEARCGNATVLYQVVEGITATESLEARNEAGVITGEAVQLGIWNNEKRSFDRFGWVPGLNCPVFKARPIELLQPRPSEYQIGNIPGTNFPVFINRELAVTHHLAILGVTGSGKSVFARNLIRQIAADNTKVICVDFTNEYKTSLADLVSGTLISESDSDELFAAVDEIGKELDEFPNKRRAEFIATRENILHTTFKNALTSFIGGSAKATLFELPDVTNSAGILDYTKWFFKVLFELAKSSQLGGKRVCVVLEEAHTIIPEWNSLGTEDRRAGSVVNSISQIALQGRKYNVGFIVIAQRTANVSKSVLTQCNSVVAFQQFDRTSAEFLGNHMGAGFVSSLPRLLPRQAIAVGKAFSSGTPVIFKVPDIEEP